MPTILGPYQDKHALMTENTLMPKTLDLIKNRPRSVTYADIAKGADVSVGWLKWFVGTEDTDKDNGPDVNKVERVYTFLNGAPLNV